MKYFTRHSLRHCHSQGKELNRNGGAVVNPLLKKLNSWAFWFLELFSLCMAHSSGVLVNAHNVGIKEQLGTMLTIITAIMRATIPLFSVLGLTNLQIFPLNIHIRPWSQPVITKAPQQYQSQWSIVLCDSDFLQWYHTNIVVSIAHSAFSNSC